jgi:hypothetical protein
MGEYVATLAIIMTFSIPILAIWTKHRKEVMQLQAHQTAEKAAQYAASNKELEDRVRVLERIVTDRGFNLAAEIEALRDRQPAAREVEETN